MTCVATRSQKKASRRLKTPHAPARNSSASRPIPGPLSVRSVAIPSVQAARRTSRRLRTNIATNTAIAARNTGAIHPAGVGSQRTSPTVVWMSTAAYVISRK